MENGATKRNQKKRRICPDPPEITRFGSLSPRKYSAFHLSVLDPSGLFSWPFSVHPLSLPSLSAPPSCPSSLSPSLPVLSVPLLPRAPWCRRILPLNLKDSWLLILPFFCTALPFFLYRFCPKTAQDGAQTLSLWPSLCAPIPMVIDILEGQGRRGAQKWPKFILG